MPDLQTAFPSVAESRAAVLEAIGPSSDLTLLVGPGNRGDDLLLHGARALLDGRAFRERRHDDLAGAEGDTAVILGSGAWSRNYHRTLIPLLAVAERRYERVVVLPSSYDTDHDRVRAALAATDALVFARERVSHARIASLCEARPAHDSAFYVDYEPYRRTGEGTLNAFRTDWESAGLHPLPPGNDDISATLPTLDAWLGRIAGAAHLRTDRAHVLLAAALMGKSVEYAPGDYFKVDALAATLPAGLPVERIPDPPRPRPRRPGPLPPAPGRAVVAIATAAAPPVAPGRVEVIVYSRMKPAHLPATLEAVLAHAPAATVSVLDANSGPATVAALSAFGGEPRIEVVLAEANVGSGAGRQPLAERSPCELLLLLDDDVELTPGALERLVADLDAHPAAQAVMPLVADPAGRVLHCGGTAERDAAAVVLRSDGAGLAHDDPGVPVTGPSDWWPGAAALVRRALVLDCPLAPVKLAPYEHQEWSVRVADRHPAAFRRCREARVIHHRAGRLGAETPLAGRDRACRRLAAHARFFEAHGALLRADGDDPRRWLDPGVPAGPAAERLALRLVSALGPRWLLAEWCAGDLGALLDAPRAGAARALAAEQRLAELEADRAWLHERHHTLARIEAGGWWRLRGRLRPALELAQRARRGWRGGSVSRRLRPDGGDR